MIHGLAHITGGGLIDNLPRVLPKNCDAVIETQQLARPADLRSPATKKGKIDRDGNVSGLQHGHRHGRDRGRTRRQTRDVDLESETNRPDRTRNRKDAASSPVIPSVVEGSRNVT